MRVCLALFNKERAAFRPEPLPDRTLAHNDVGLFSLCWVYYLLFMAK